MKTSVLMRGILGLAFMLASIPFVLFTAAGTTRWPEAWIYTALLLGSTIISRLVVWVRTPELLYERAQFGEGEGTHPADRFLVLFVGLVGPLLMAASAGLDHRHGWSPPVLAGWRVAAGLGILFGYGLAVWAMIANRYFSAVVRLQDDRGHAVVSEGPYAFMRHPAYAGAVLAAVALPVLLSSVWTYVPGVIYVMVLVLRTKLEDDFLQTTLDGYPAYGAQVKYRLLPGIW